MTITAELADGRRLEFPDGTDPTVIQSTVKKLVSPDAGPKPAPTTMQKIQSSMPGRVIQGMRDPIDAGAQILSHVMPDAVTNALDYLPSKLRNSDSPFLQTIGETFFADPRAKATDQRIADTEQQYEQARQATGQNGADVARFVGNAVSPVNVGIAKLAPSMVGKSVPKLAATGAAIGGVGGGLTPVTNPNESFGEQKAAQVGLGAVTGAVATPALSKLTEAVAPRVAAWFQSRFRPEELGARASLKTDEAIATALKEIGADVDSVPQAYMADLRQKVVDSLKQGKLPDVAALMREKDFQSLGVQPLKGQLTRDATTYANERNLRAVPGIGEPLMNVMTQQNRRLQDVVAGYGGPKAAESQVAGKRLADALSAYDKNLRTGATTAYKAARDSAGKDAELALQGLSQDISDIGKRYGKGNEALRWAKGYLADTGIFGGKQTKVFTVQDAEQALQDLNKAIGSDKAAQNAAAEIRKALKKAVTEGGDDVFGEARKLAATRFALHDEVPALAAAAEGTLTPDKFVSQHLIDADTSKVKALAKALDPNAFQEARNQIGAHLERAAYGENVAGDKIFAPERFAKELRRLGTEKLKIFFSPDEVNQLQTLSRVGAYINQAPAASPVLGNPNMAWAGQLLGRVPGVGQGAQLALALGRMARQGADVSASVGAKVPVQPSQLDPQTVRRLAQALAIGSSASGSLAAQ